MDMQPPPKDICSGAKLQWHPAARSAAGAAADGLSLAKERGINLKGPGRVESDLSMKTKTNFAFRIDIWDDTGDSIVEHVAGVGDFEVAEVTYRAAVARWPAARIAL